MSFLRSASFIAVPLLRYAEFKLVDDNAGLDSKFHLDLTFIAGDERQITKDVHNYLAGYLDVIIVGEPGSGDFQNLKFHRDVKKRSVLATEKRYRGRANSVDLDAWVGDQINLLRTLNTGFLSI